MVLKLTQYAEILLLRMSKNFQRKILPRNLFLNRLFRRHPHHDARILGNRPKYCQPSPRRTNFPRCLIGFKTRTSYVDNPSKNALEVSIKKVTDKMFFGRVEDKTFLPVFSERPRDAHTLPYVSTYKAVHYTHRYIKLLWFVHVRHCGRRCLMICMIIGQSGA